VPSPAARRTFSRTTTYSLLADLWNNPAPCIANIKKRKHANVQKLVYGVGIAIALMIVIGLALPRHTVVTTEVRIDAPSATVFALVNDFHRQALWSPWFETDPNVRIIYSGPDRGVDATMTWNGTIIGSGTQVITESRSYEHVTSIMNSAEASESRTWFDLANDSGATIISWGFESDHGYNLVGRYFSPMLGGIVRRDYDRGLANLKELAESLPRADFSDIEIEHLVVTANQIAYLPTTATPEPAAISAALGDAYFEVLKFMGEHDLQLAGAPISITRSFSGAELQFDAAIPVRGAVDTTPRDGANVRLGSSYEGQVIRIKHVGPYRSLSRTHQKIAAYLAALDLQRNGDAWESYVGDPTKVAQEELLTYVYYPIRR
jgi:effector-binding domain-containing protein